MTDAPPTHPKDESPRPRTRPSSSRRVLTRPPKRVPLHPQPPRQILKLASINLCPNVSGQICCTLMMTPPEPGEPSHELVRLGPWPFWGGVSWCFGWFSWC
jgi:hypothetical protein